MEETVEVVLQCKMKLWQICNFVNRQFYTYSLIYIYACIYLFVITNVMHSMPDGAQYMWAYLKILTNITGKLYPI